MNDNDIVRRTDIINRLLDRSKPLKGLIHVDDVIRTINVAPSVNPKEPSNISNDGTLTVNVEDGRKISRVLVCGANHWGGLYYPDEQEPMTGHWIYDRRREWDGECKYECSECGMGSDVDYAYCMRCGAKMIEPQESEVEQ